MYRIATYFSDPQGGNYFSDKANRLRENCNALGIELISQHVPTRDWLHAVRYKPFAIWDIFDYSGGGFIFIDCDCLVLKVPDFKFRRWGVMLREDGTAHDFVHYVPNNSAARKILTKWVMQLDKNRKYGSHTAFHKATEGYKFDIIPEGYFQLEISDTESKRETYPNHV